jgi:hypothetical protein
VYCDEKIVAGVSFCTKCGKPTEWATHDQRIEYELSQWGSVRGAPAKSRKSAPVVSLRAVQEATQHVPSPLVRTASAPVEEQPMRKVELHPLAKKVRTARRVSKDEAFQAAPAHSIVVTQDIIPAPRAKKLSIKRHERASHPEERAPAPAGEMPPAMEVPAIDEAQPAKPVAAKARAPKARAPKARAPKVSPKSKHPKKPASEGARLDKPAAMKTAAKSKATPKKKSAPVGSTAKREPQRAQVKKGTNPPQAEMPVTAGVVIDLNETRMLLPTEQQQGSESQTIRVLERQVELLGEIVRKLSALEKKLAPMSAGTNGTRATAVEVIASSNGHANGNGSENGRKLRRFWFAKH